MYSVILWFNDGMFIDFRSCNMLYHSCMLVLHTVCMKFVWITFLCCVCVFHSPTFHAFFLIVLHFSWEWLYFNPLNKIWFHKDSNNFLKNSSLFGISCIRTVKHWCIDSCHVYWWKENLFVAAVWYEPQSMHCIFYQTC